MIYPVPPLGPQAARSLAADAVDSVDVVVGSAGTAADLARLGRIEGIQRNGWSGPGNKTAARFAARSVESGLLTLVVRGKPGFFDTWGGARLEVDDITTLHVMGDAVYTSVAALLADPAAGFQVLGESVWRGGGISLC